MLSSRNVSEAEHDEPGRWRDQRNEYGSRRRPLTRPTFPDGVIPAIAAVVVWVTVLLLVRAHPPAGYWNVVGIAGGFVGEVVAVVAMVRFIRWARRRSKRTPRP